MQNPFWPPPKRLQRLQGALPLCQAACPIITDQGPAIAWLTQRFATSLSNCLPQSSTWGLTLNGGQTPQDGYILEITPTALNLRAHNRAGLIAGLQTLWQWFQAHRSVGTLPCLRIEDAPDFKQRGILLDVSRGKVPRMETLFQLVDRFAEWKINQLQLYIEHTFAYKNHRKVWDGHNPITPGEFRELSLYCVQRGITLVPNQNSFGHFHRWLVHEPYHHLAECPAGIEHPFSLELEPFSLCPQDPKSVALLKDLYCQMVPLTIGDFLNVGLDETFDLGMGRSKAACEHYGKSQVYLNFLNRVAECAAEHQRSMMFWGDILIEQPEKLNQIPANAVPLLWGYEAGHPFDAQAQTVAATGREFYVCPGTSSWNSFGGRFFNAMANLREAALFGHRHGATGYLITDWGDFGHLQSLVVSFPAFTYGAGLSWNRQGSTHQETRACQHALKLNQGDGRLPFQALAKIHRASRTGIMNGSALFFAVIRSQDSLDHPKLQPLANADLDAAQELLDEVLPAWRSLKLNTEDRDICAQEIHWTHDLLDYAITVSRARVGENLNGGNLKKKFARLRAQFETVRNLRYRPGGFLESVNYLWRSYNSLLGKH